MLKRTTVLLKWGVLLLLAVITIAFAVANRQVVVVRLDPLPLEVQPVPMYAVVFAAVLVGLLIGGIAAWLRALRWRRWAAQERQRADRLSRELAQAQRNAAAAGGAGGSGTDVARVA